MALVILLLMIALIIVSVVKTKEFRATARQKLSGKWGKSVFIILAYMLISFLLNIISSVFSSSAILATIASIAVAIIGIPLSYGLTASFLKLYHSEDIGAFDFLSIGFNNFKRAWAVALRMFLKLVVPFLVFLLGTIVFSTSMLMTSMSASIFAETSSSDFSIVTLIGFALYFVGIIWLLAKSLKYAMAYYIAIDSPELTAKEAVEQSAEMMINNRIKLLLVPFAFIGWAILATIPLGIGLLWLVPYMNFTELAFYHFVANKDDNTVVDEVSNNTEF